MTFSRQARQIVDIYEWKIKRNLRGYLPELRSIYREIFYREILNLLQEKKGFYFTFYASHTELAALRMDNGHYLWQDVSCDNSDWEKQTNTSSNRCYWADNTNIEAIFPRT